MEISKPQSKNVIEQVQRVTTVHGTSHFGSKHGRSLALWCAIIAGNIALTSYYLVVINDKFNENEIVTQINANCKVNQVPFPAVSICNFNMVSVKESANINEILKQNNRPQKEIKEFFDSLPHLKNYNRISQHLRNFTEIMNILKLHYFTMDTIMEEVHQKCDSLLLYCTFNRKVKKCDDIFSLIKTYEGYCCAFNYAALDDASDMSLLPPDKDLEYYDDQDNDDSSPRRIIMTSEAGSKSGLSVIVNIEPNDYPSWSNTSSYYGAKIIISDPNDYPETTTLYRYVSLGESMDIKVEAMLFQSSSELKRVPAEKRGCWFYDEVVLEHTDRYSYETCNSECKMKTYMDSCGCIPYKYPREKSTRVCELEDLKCLNNVTVHKSIIDMDCHPICLMECRDIKYKITSNLVPFVIDGYKTTITQNANHSELAAVQVYFGTTSCNCYKLSMLIDINYFIATYGGVFSLSFGASILTLFEFSFILLTATANSIMKAITKGHTNNSNTDKNPQVFLQ